MKKWELSKTEGLLQQKELLEKYNEFIYQSRQSDKGDTDMKSTQLKFVPPGATIIFQKYLLALETAQKLARTAKAVANDEHGKVHIGISEMLKDQILDLQTMIDLFSEETDWTEPYRVEK